MTQMPSVVDATDTTYLRNLRGEAHLLHFIISLLV